MTHVRLAVLLPLLCGGFVSAQSVPANGREVLSLQRDAPVRQFPFGRVLGNARTGQRIVTTGSLLFHRRVTWAGRTGFVSTRSVGRQAGPSVEVRADTTVRASANAAGASLGQAKRGQAYAELSRAAGWVQVQFDHRPGWLPVAQTASLGAGSTAPRRPAPAPAPPTTPTPSSPAPRFSPGSGSGAGTAAGARRLLAERVGFGRQTTGGDPGLVYRVTTTRNSGSGSLRAGCESDRPYWIVFATSGTIRLSSPIRIRANKTLDGRGRNVVIRGSLRVDRVRNVIINDLKVTSPDGDDAILLTGDGGSSVSDFDVRNVWLHHLELYDSHDGLVDLRGATDVTISWCLFRNHAKSALLWKDRRGRAASGMHVTMHHNFFNGTTRRNPSFNYGKLDYFNNYIAGFWEYGLGYFENCQVLSEGNIYEARSGFISFSRDPNSGDFDLFVKKDAVINDWSGRPPGNLRSVGDVRRNGANIVVRNASSVFNRATYYPLTPDPAGDRLRARIVNGAGPR